ncbi:GNAT family N-acetyltransferase [Nocardioides bruguierae]|uniref:GNAT family N-acetyltransferase n=1 Tax=Nocardioides bruguierae TaxID=2945102 RepID=A0A9X2IFI1_9ACTN|nr:GNAT family N-acetyltransferase [Nocardioides bruguierae]MCM0621098.1 GNAT family N-acetyltransferase [Nocardioides bruguierae]
MLRTERLALPLWSAQDVAALRAGRRHPDWHPDFPRRDDQDAAVLWVEGDGWGPRSIVRGRTVLGSIGCFGPPEPHAGDAVLETEVGYGLVDEAHGYGFASEALAGLTAAVDALGASGALPGGVRLRAAVRPENAASLKVLARCGFTGLRGSDEDGHLVMLRPVPPAAAVRDAGAS